MQRNGHFSVSAQLFLISPERFAMQNLRFFDRFHQFFIFIQYVMANKCYRYFSKLFSRQPIRDLTYLSLRIPAIAIWSKSMSQSMLIHAKLVKSKPKNWHYSLPHKTALIHHIEQRVMTRIMLY